MSFPTIKTIALGTLLSTQTSCGTQPTGKIQDVKLLFTDAQLMGEWRLVSYQSGSLDKKTIGLISSHTFFATVEFFQTKPQQIQLLIGDNIVSYQYLNKPIARLNPSDKIELTILMRSEEPLNEYISNLKIQTEEIF